MKILIVGGLGYIGGRLAEYFTRTNKDIEIELTSRRDNIPSWAKKIHIHQADLTDDKSVHACLNVSSPDVVIHLGAVAQAECIKDPVKAEEVNANGTLRLLEAATAANVKRFIYFSTFQIYGTLSGIIDENSPTNPTHPYPVSKLNAESLIKNFGYEQQIKTLILRLSNAYGYPMDPMVAKHVWTLVFNAFSRDCIVKGEIFPKGWVYRDFITLTDVVRAVDHFLFKIPDNWEDGLFNLGGENSLAITEVAGKVAEIYEKHYQEEIHIAYPPKIETERFTYSIDKIKSTGFTLKGDMEEEILETMKRIKQYSKEI